VRKFEKTFRILVPQINVKGKHYLTDEETDRLLSGHVCILEKYDGANTAVIRHGDTFDLQKRGSLIIDSTHPQFGFFKSWAANNYDKLMQIPDNTILYAELMYCQHTIFYDMLPDYWLAFAWFDLATNQYRHRDDMVELCDRIGLSYVPEICRGVGYKKEDLFDLIPDPSAYGHQEAEGLVCWNYDANMRGKVVREKFVKDMLEDGHWDKGPIRKNIVSNTCHCK
jgi:hypothetical protein